MLDLPADRRPSQELDGPGWTGGQRAGLDAEARVCGSARNWSQRSTAEVCGALRVQDNNGSCCRRTRVEKTAWVDVDDGKNGERMLKPTGSVKSLWTRMVFGEG